MEIIEWIVAVSTGLVFGSFLNVCIVRLPKGESIVKPASHCRSCGKPVRPWDNIPLASWLMLGGRCRACGVRVPVRYPLVEAGSAVLFLACCLRFRAGLDSVGMAAFCWLLLGLAWMDAETFLLPDMFTIPGILVGLLYGALHGNSGVQAILGAVAIGGFLLLISIVYRLVRKRDGMGFGDVKLGCMLGAWLGWQLGAVALFLAIAVGAIGGGVIVALYRRRAGSGSQTEADKMLTGNLHVPFGTFLAGAGIVTVFAGDPLLRWYLAFFQ